MLVDQYTWDMPEVIKKLKTLPPIFRHFNYSLKGENSYKVETIMRDASPNIIFKTRLIKNMMAHAHGVQIGQLRIYFSSQMPVGLFHPDCGPICMDNFWLKETAYHLNRINRNLDQRMSMENFHNTLNHYLREETKRDIKLYIPDVNDYHLRQKTLTYDYVTAQIW